MQDWITSSLDELIDISGDDTNKGFVIDNDNAADWAVRKIKQAREQRDREMEHYKRQMQLSIERCEQTETRMTAMLAPYLDQVPAHETKTMRKYALPSGTIMLKQQQPKYNQDNDALCAWLIGNGMADKVKAVETYKADWAGLKPLTEVLPDGSVVYKETGEVVQGVSAEVRPPEFKVEV